MTDAERLVLLQQAAQLIIDRLHELLGAGTLQDDVIQDYLGRWMTAMEAQ